MSILFIKNEQNGEFEGVTSLQGKAATLELLGAYPLPYGSSPTVTEEAGSTEQVRKYRIGIPEGKPGETTENTMSSVEIDETLMISGKAADAGVVGERFDELSQSIDEVIQMSETQPKSENTNLWVKPSSETLKIPQINDSAESEEDTWSSKKIASALKSAGDSAGGGTIWYGQGIPPEGYELGIFIESEGDA